jgi:hypothetical protein
MAVAKELRTVAETFARPGHRPCDPAAKLRAVRVFECG